MPELITGGAADSDDPPTPWPGPPGPDDRGAADHVVAAALSAFASGQGSEHAALTALAATRLLVPVVARQTGSASEMALPTLVGTDGRPAVLAFTCLDALTRWRRDARPVPVPASRVWQAAWHEADAAVIDVAGPVPFAVEGARLAALAQGQPVPLPQDDPDVRAALARACAGEPAVKGARLATPTAGGDVAVMVTLAPGVRSGQAAQRCVRRFVAATGDRLRRGVEVSVAMGGSAPCAG